MIAVINLKMPHLRKRIFSVIQQKQNGKCRHCRKNITLQDTVRAILKEEQGHLHLCTKLAMSNAAAA
jgi:hypothetical protein